MKKPKIFCKKTYAIFTSTLIVALLVWSCVEELEPLVLVPEITSITPTSAQIEDTVVITGINFNELVKNNIVTFEGTNAEVIECTTTSITATVPGGIPSGVVSVQVKAYGVTTDGIAFTAIWPAPEINTVIIPGSGSIGDTVSIVGKNFAFDDPNDNVVTFNGVSASLVASENTAINAIIPTGATAGNIVVTTYGQVSNGFNFDFPSPATTDSLEVTIDNEDNDAEEATNREGLVSTTNTDLELGKWDTNGTPDWGQIIVGCRYPTTSIPSGAIIVGAKIQFEVDEVDTNPTEDTRIWGENTSDAVIYTTDDYNISDRERTTASILWENIPAWENVGDRGEAQKTPNLIAIVAEIAKVGWSPGNSLNFMMEPNNPVALNDGNEGRVAEAGVGDGPSLKIYYYVP